VKLPEMKAGLTISAMLHAALLLWGIISFAARPLEARPNDALPIDIISDKQFSEITKGVKNGAKDKLPAPLVEKVGDPKPVDDSTAKPVDKKELTAAKTDAPPPPAEQPAPKPAEAKPEKKEPPKIDPIAETLKKEEAKKKAEEKAKAKAAAQQAKPQPQFDPTKIAALLDKREPTRQASVGDTLSPIPSLGKSDGRAAQLSQSEIDALRKRLGECWNPPAGARDAGQLKVVLRVLFKPDATVATPPQLVAGTPSPFGPAMAESAKRAILSCQPFTMLRADTYQLWKDIEITFDPREMFGG
jgi:outer membrane biosynthesis protein TonB